MRRLLRLIFLLALPIIANAQLNTNRLLDIGRNALYFEDYVVAIQYFNQVIKVRPYLTEPYFLRAYAKMNLDDFRGAIDDCDKALEINPFLAKVFYCRGFAYRSIGNLEKSSDDFRKALELEPDNINTSHLLIENLIQMRHFDEALQLCRRSLEDYPRYSDTYLLRSQVFLAKKDTLRAFADLDTAIIYDGNNDIAFALRGMMKYEQKLYADGLSDLDEAILINPFRSEYFGNRAIVKMQLDDLRGAMSDFDTSLSIDNRNVLSYFNRALLRAQVGDDNRAVEDLDYCLALDPNNYSAYLQRAYLHLKLGDYDHAINDFSTIIGRYPDFVVAYYGRAQAKRLNGDKSGADKDEYAAITIEDEIKSGKRKQRSGDDRQLSASAEGRALVQALDKQRGTRYDSDLRGQVQYKDIDVEPLGNFTMSRPDTARHISNIKLYNAGIERFNAATGEDLEFCIYRDNITAAQLDSCFKRIEHTTRLLNETGYDEMLLMQRAYCLSIVGDYDNALADYDRILPHNPANVLAYFNRANVRLAEAMASAGEDKNVPQAEYSLAISDFKMAFNLDNRFVYALYNAGYVYLLEKNFAKASECFTKAIGIFPEFAEAYYNRGLIYIFQGDKEKGREDLSKAGELGLHQAYNVIRRYAY